MSEPSKGLDCAAEQNSVGPDYFGYYAREVAELLSRDEDFLPFSSQTSEFARNRRGDVQDKDASKHVYTGNLITNSIGDGPLFSDAAGAGVSEVKKERLRAMLRHSVVILSREVDEVLDPVIGMCRLRARIRQKSSPSCNIIATCEEDAEKRPHKKSKLDSSPSSGSGDEHIALAVPGKDISDGLNKQCSTCRKIDNCNKKNGPEVPKFLCNACSKQGNEFLSNKDPNELYLGSNVAVEEEKGEVDDDLQFLLEKGGPKVEEKIMKYSDELSARLKCMQQKLEELLDIVMSSCRSMTHLEKQQLQKMIKKLPPKNLDRVVEIIRPGTTLDKGSSEEIHVNLEYEDNATLWRLYYYVQTFENAKKLVA